MQKKDIIYIDVEDDITAIIGKIKESKEKIIALVPPKRIGVLQSAVNLRLLARTADHAKKRLVIITANSALSSLAASASIPVAKTLQSKPGLAEVPALSVDDEEVIDGEQLPVGDHAGLDTEADDGDDSTVQSTLPAAAIAGIDIDGETASAVAKNAKEGKSPKRKVKVPDFGSFRKKMVIGGVLGVLLIGFFVWAIWFAPHASVVVSARTSDVEIQTPITIGEGIKADNEEKTLPAVVKTEKQTDTIEFTPTGEEEVGEKASGTVKFYNCSVSGSAATVQSGTYISSGGKNYVVQSTVTIPNAGLGGSSNVCDPSFINPGVSGDVRVVAEEIGADYNMSDDVNFDVAGNSDVVAISSSAISGGSKKTITVVSASDIQKAREELAEENSDSVKKALVEKFEDDVIVIDDSFRTSSSKQDITPGLGEEASGTATLTAETVYAMSGVAQPVLSAFLDTAITQQLGNLDGKRIYESGAKESRLADFELGSDKKKATVQLNATGKVGPKITDEQIKDIVRGKRYGEIETELKSIEGVSDVKVDLSPFWVFTVPGDDNKITVEFKLLDGDD